MGGLVSRVARNPKARKAVMEALEKALKHSKPKSSIAITGPLMLSPVNFLNGEGGGKDAHAPDIPYLEEKLLQKLQKLDPKELLRVKIQEMEDEAKKKELGYPLIEIDHNR